MKKYLSLILVSSCLTACSTYEPDMQKAAQTRQDNINARRAEVGCQFMHTHEEYKKCLMDTYNASIEREYKTTIHEDGRPLAVISEKPVEEPKCAKNNQPDYFIIEVAEQKVPAPVIAPTPAPVVETPAPAEKEIMEVIEVTEEVKPQIVTVTTTETVTKKPVEVIPVIETPVVEEVIEPVVEEVVEEVIEPVIEPEIEFLEVAPVEEPILECPCEDPLDPCPQCVMK